MDDYRKYLKDTVASRRRERRVREIMRKRAEAKKKAGKKKKGRKKSARSVDDVVKNVVTRDKTMPKKTTVPKGKKSKASDDLYKKYMEAKKARMKKAKKK